jgi:hypothetical protein
MLPKDMLSMLQKQPSTNHAQFKSFPWVLLLNPKLIDDIKASDTRRLRVKYTFGMLTTLFDRVVAPFFYEPIEDIFTELFCDEAGFSLTKESIWAKIVFLEGGNGPSTISIKHVPSRMEIAKNYIAYTEAKIHAHSSQELFDLATLLLQNLPEKIELHVRRLTYKHKESTNITLYRVRFENGDFYTVFSISANVPIAQVDNLTSTDEVLNTGSNQEVMDVIRQHSAPAHSKIIEFLYRHKQSLFDSLIKKGHVQPEATDSCNDGYWDSDKEYDEPTDEHSLSWDERIDYCLEKNGIGIQPYDLKFMVLSDNVQNKWKMNDYSVNPS